MEGINLNPEGEDEMGPRRMLVNVRGVRGAIVVADFQQFREGGLDEALLEFYLLRALDLDHTIRRLHYLQELVGGSGGGC